MRFNSIKKYLVIIIAAGVFCGSVCVVWAGFEVVPRASGYVNDYAGVISDDTEATLEQFLSYVETKTTAEIALVTVKSLKSEPIELYAEQLFREWGIGKKGEDNGLLFLVAPNERKMRIEVGYGLEGALPDGLCGQIRDQYVLPFFKQDDYAQGILQGIVALVTIIGKEYNVDFMQIEGLKTATPHEAGAKSSSLASLLGDALYIIILVVLCGGRYWFFPLFFGYPRRRGYWSGGGYYSGSGGFNGGFGAFGGGMSGGGGVSGSW